MIEELKYCKVREVKSPCRAHPEDAGMDFFVPTNLTEDIMREKCKVTGDDVDMVVENGIVKSMTLKPGQSVLIPSGIKVNVPDGYALIYTNKSGVSSKRHLVVGASCVDIGYSGECNLNLHNIGTIDQIIEAGDKIVQGIMFKLGFHVPTEVKTEAELYPVQSDRGAGGFGSSGTK